MNINTLAAAMNVAWGVAGADKMADEEWAVLFKEMDSYRLDAKQREDLIARFKSMDVLEGINTLRAADAATRDEAEALVFITTCNDGKASDIEIGAFILMSQLCKFRGIKADEAHRILGF